MGEESGATGIVLWSSGTTLMLTGVEGSFVEGEVSKYLILNISKINKTKTQR